MTKKTMMLESQMAIHKVVQIFLELQISSAPVVDRTGKVLGLISDENLMKAYARSISTESSVQTLENFADLLLPAKFVYASDRLSTVVSAMLACPTKRVLVQDDVTAVIGIISPKDILRALSGQKRSNLQSKVQELEQKNSDLKNSLSEKEKGIEKFRSILHDSPIMMLTVDLEGKITLANDMLAHFLGYHEVGLLGKTIFEITPETVHDQVRKNILNFDANPRQKSDLMTLQTHMGQKRRVELMLSVIHDKAGKVTELLIMAHAIDSDDLLRALNGVTKF